MKRTKYKLEILNLYKFPKTVCEYGALLKMLWYIASLLIQMKISKKIWRGEWRGRRQRFLIYQCDSPATQARQRMHPKLLQQTRSHSEYTPIPSTTSPRASPFPLPFSSCHSNWHSQLVKVHYTLSYWPEIYIPQCLCHKGGGCNPLRLMTVRASWQKYLIVWLFSAWINMIEYYYAELTLIAVILKSDVFAEEPYVTRLHAFSKR